LNDNIDYKDGEVVFTNGISSEKIMINQCDMLIYNGKQLRTNGNVSGGVKYILVLMLEIMQ
jgi:predicted 2-oxoglutarate/Fe(II)-dependent dioxygenase YbiX